MNGHQPDSQAFGGTARAFAGWALALWLAGCLLRLSAPGLSAFGLDEGIACILTRRWMETGEFPLVGVRTSLFFYNPPLLLYVLAPFLLLAADPRVAVLGVGVAGCLAPLCTALAAWVWAPRRSRALAASIALALASTSPAWIEHSRRLWGHAFELPLASLAMLFAALWMRERKPWALAGLIASGLAAQAMHFSGSLLLLAAVAAFALARRGSTRPPLSPAALLAGLAIALLWYGPYAVHLVRTGFEDLRIVLRAATGARAGAGATNFPPLESFLAAFGDLLHNDTLGTGYLAHPINRVAAYATRAASVVWIVIALLGVRFALCRRAPISLWFLLGAAVLPVVTFTLLRVTFVPAYLLPSLPAWVILASLTAARWIRRAPRTGRRLVGSLIALSCGAGVLLAAHSLLLLGRATPADPYFTTLAWQQEAIRHLARATPSGDTAWIRQAGRPPESGLDYSYAYLLWAETGTPERFTDHEGWSRVFVLRDAKEQLSAEYLQQLESIPAAQFGSLRLYELRRPGAPHAPATSR